LAEHEAAGRDSGQLGSDYRLVAREGRIVWIHEETTTVRDASGKPIYAQTFLVDVSDRRRADEERERLRAAERTAANLRTVRQRRLDLLRDAGEVLGSATDMRASLQRVVELVVQDLADWSAIDLLEPNGELTRTGVARAEPRGAEPAHEPDAFVQAVIKSGLPLVVPATPHRDSAEEAGELPRGVVSLISVPVTSRGRPLGALTLGRTSDGSDYGGDEVALAEDLAARIGIAIDRARLYLEVEERADAARVLTYVADAVLLLDRADAGRLWN